ncbi:MAG: hypothetical protein JZD40_02715 [Sulfolobus sp.]|nr:hypothetical protein [Sulfolobus sp.]
MKSFLGSTIVEERGVIYIAETREDAEKVLARVKRIYADFNVFILDLSNPEDKIYAIDIDPDLGDFNKGFAIVVSVS